MLSLYMHRPIMPYYQSWGYGLQMTLLNKYSWEKEREDEGLQ